MNFTIRDFKRFWRELLIIIVYAVPMLTLMVLGVLWLRENGYAVHFAVATLVTTIVALTIRAVWTRPTPSGDLLSPPGASEAERKARAALTALINESRAKDLSSTSAAQTLAVKTIRAVADAYHPGDQTSWLNFSIPELLLLTEDVSSRLRGALLPILRHAEISTILKGHALFTKASKLVTAVSQLRWLNPESAIVKAVQGHVIAKVVDGVTDSAKAKAAAIIVEQVGEVSIKLYSGAYRRTLAEMPSTASAEACRATIWMRLARQSG